MEQFNEILGAVGGVVWGPVMLVLLLGTGVYLTIGLKAMPWRRIGYAFKMLWKGRDGTGDGEISLRSTP